MPVAKNTFNAAIVFVLSWSLWATLAVSASHHIAEILKPLVQWEMTILAPRYEIKDFSVHNAGLEIAFRVKVLSARPQAFGTQTFPAGVVMESSTLVGHLLQSLVVTLSILSTTALLSKERIMVLVLTGLLVLLLLVMVDVPMVLVAALDDVVLATVPLTDKKISPWVLWMNFLNGGGRMALGIAAGLMVIAVSRVDSVKEKLLWDWRA